MRVPREEGGGRVDQTFVAVDVGIELVVAIRNAHCAHTHTLSYPYNLKFILIFVFYVNSKKYLEECKSRCQDPAA
jgi:hypothetical protein